MAFRTAHPLNTQPKFRRRFGPRWVFVGRRRVFPPELQQPPTPTQQLEPVFFTAPSPTVFAPALEQVTTQALEPGFFDNQLAPIVYAPELIPGQPLAPDTVIVEAGEVFEPALIPQQFLLPDTWMEPEPEVFDPSLIAAPPPLEPDAWTEPESTVYGPSLVGGQNLHPDTFTVPAATVYSPALEAGAAIRPDTLTGALSPTVFAPALVAGHVLRPTRIDLAPQVFSPRLVRADLALRPTRIESTLVVFSPELRHGQELRPATLAPALSPIVFNPRLIAGQFLNPTAFTGSTPVVFAPRLIPGQFLEPDVLPGLTIVVRSPRLQQAQSLYPGPPYDLPDATVYPPALQHAPEPGIGTDDERTFSALRTGR